MTGGALSGRARRAWEAVGEAVGAVLARPRHLVLAALVVGLLLGPVDRRVVEAALVGVLVAMVALRRPGLGLLAAGALMGGAVLAQARLQVLDRTVLPARYGHVVRTEVILLEQPRRHPFGSWTAAVRLSSWPGRGERVVLRGSRSVGRPQVAVGAQLEAEGALQPLASWQDYERVRGAHAALVLTRVHPTGRRRGGVVGVADALRRRAEAGVTAGLPPPQAALARGMVLGQDDALDDGTRKEFQGSGLAHLLAASGQNVALLAVVAAAALAMLGVGLRGRLLGALALVALYVPLAGAGPSIQRAGVMGAAGLIAALAGRPGSRAYALLLAAAVTLTVNPRASADVGWQLSFVAVLAIALLAGRWREALADRKVPPSLAAAAGLTGAATAGTAPLLALHFGQLSLVALPANLLVAPAVAPVVWLGTGSALLGELGAGQPAAGLLAHAAGGLAQLLNAVVAFPLGYVGWLAHAAAGLPWATTAVTVGGPIGLLACYAALASLVASRRLRLLGAGAAVAALLALAWGRLHPPGPPPGLTISFLDVGQGDATLVQHAEHAILVDTGPPDGPILARLRRAGVHRLDLLVLTHAQADHEGAARAVLDAMPVAAVLDGGWGTRSAERAQIEAAERRARVRRLLPVAGQVLHDGSLAFDVLWPRRDAPDTGDPNDRAVVGILRDGRFSALLTADAESPVTLPLDLPAVDVLKVAHHGSADPGLPALLARLRPRLAAIEVGRHNRYGHPSAATVGALRGVPAVVRTDRDGTVQLSVVGDRLEVRPHA